MKRALRSFGHQFGNSLYGDGTYEDKIGNGTESQPPQQPPASNGQRTHDRVQGGAFEGIPTADKIRGNDADWMGEESKEEVKADGKLLAEIQKLGAQVYGESEWVNGTNAAAAGWGVWRAGDRRDQADAG